MSSLESVKGRIHSFETFGTLDGPGIRFVVFMQGCPLRCIYCHNRDTWEVWSGTEYTAGQVVKQMLEYIDFIRSSGGGITVTGGEPLLQPMFVTRLFMRCRELDVHTALDTSGFAETCRVQELLEYTSLVLLDIKHADSSRHREITGVGNRKIKGFAEYVSSRGIPIWIRYVLLPGYTDTPGDLEAAGQFISTLETVERVDVLPYHGMGRFKWESAGEKYPAEGIREPDEEEIHKANSILRGYLEQ